MTASLTVAAARCSSLVYSGIRSARALGRAGKRFQLLRMSAAQEP